MDLQLCVNLHLYPHLYLFPGSDRRPRLCSLDRHSSPLCFFGLILVDFLNSGCTRAYARWAFSPGPVSMPTFWACDPDGLLCWQHQHLAWPIRRWFGWSTWSTNPVFLYRASTRSGLCRRVFCVCSHKRGRRWSFTTHPMPPMPPAARVGIGAWLFWYAPACSLPGVSAPAGWVGKGNGS
jgi:hypothetical protein